MEVNVGIISTWIIAALMNQTYFSIHELNEAIHLKLETFNQKPFQKKIGSRQTASLEEEKFALLPLPTKPYELATWKKAIVPLDYHIIVDKKHYSIPYEYVKHEVDIRITSNHMRIASHVRLKRYKGNLFYNSRTHAREPPDLYRVGSAANL